MERENCLLAGPGLLHSSNWTFVGPIAKHKAKSNKDRNKKKIAKPNVNLTIFNIEITYLKRNSNYAEHDALSQKY